MEGLWKNVALWALLAFFFTLLIAGIVGFVDARNNAGKTADAWGALIGAAVAAASIIMLIKP